MKELGAYIGLLYGALNVVSLIAIFLFDYYERKFGGPWENAALAAMFMVPFVLIASFGYALGAYFRDRKGFARLSYRCVAAAALFSAALTCVATLVTELPIASSDVRLAVVGAYFGALGMISSLICVFWRHHFLSAA